jgi:hypothetical protein
MNSGNLRAGPMWMLGDRSHRSGPHQFRECLRAPDPVTLAWFVQSVPTS